MTYLDHLHLREIEFSDVDLVVFFGRSGSGKSETIRFLLNEHPDFQEKVEVCDEVVTLPDLRLVYRSLRERKRTLVAAHLHPAYFWPFRFCWNVRSCFVDRSTEALESYLQESGIHYSDETLLSYFRLFKGSFADLNLILERYDSKDFDLSFARFRRFCQIDLTA